MSWFDYLGTKKPSIISVTLIDDETRKCEFREANNYGIVVILDGFDKPTFYPWRMINNIDEE